MAKKAKAGVKVVVPDRNSKASNQDPLHGVTLKLLLTRLVEKYGWEELGRRINIRCFSNDPSITSSLKFLRQWHSPLTVLNFFLMGTASGFTLASLLSALSGSGSFAYFSGMAIFLTLAALASRAASLARNRRLRGPTTLQSAIGVHHPNIRQIAQGAMGGSFNTRAFMHSYGPAVLVLARRFFLLAGFLVPLGLLVISDQNGMLACALAVVLQFLGLLTERWYFFIEAEHPQNVYYQMIS